MEEEVGLTETSIHLGLLMHSSLTSPAAAMGIADHAVPPSSYMSLSLAIQPVLHPDCSLSGCFIDHSSSLYFPNRGDLVLSHGLSYLGILPSLIA